MRREKSGMWTRNKLEEENRVGALLVTRVTRSALCLALGGGLLLGGCAGDAATDEGGPDTSSETGQPDEEGNDGASPVEQEDSTPVGDVSVGDQKVELEVGDPIEAAPMSWTYVDVPESICQDGRETGFGVNINPDSDKLILFMEGGGACLNTTTCLGNPQSFGESDLGTPGGALSRDLENNPFKDWNLVYVPYCSGDIFTGNTMNGEGGRPQMGYNNLTEFLARIVPTFPDVNEVILSGSSAGGFGAAFNWMRVQDAFGDIPVHALDDSGPPMNGEFLTPCFQSYVADLWGWADTLHPACLDCDVEAGFVAEPMLHTALARQNKGQRFGLMSYTEDNIIKLFFSFGLDECASTKAFFAPPYPEGLFPRGLEALRDAADRYGNSAVYIIEGAEHTFLGGDLSRYESGGVNMLDWVTDFRDGAPGWDHVSP